MKGSIQVTFLSMFANTVKNQGVTWAAGYYLGKGMQEWELNFWLCAVQRMNMVQFDMV